MAWITKEGRTVDEARAAAVSEAGRPAEELEVEVVSEGAKGLFGLGGEPAVVRVRPRDEAADVRDAFHDDHSRQAASSVAASSATEEEDERPARDQGEPTDEDRDQEGPEGDEEDEEDEALRSERQEQAAELGAEIVRGVMERMGLEGEVSTRVTGGTVYVEVLGDEMGILIGRSGATLEALQEVVRAGIQRRLKTRQAVVVDVEGYWERRRKERPGGRNNRGGSGGGGRRGRGRRRGGGGRPRGAEGSSDES